MVRAPDVGSLLNVKPDSNWTRRRGTTVFAGVKVGRSVLMEPSGSSSCDRVAHNRSSTLRAVVPGVFSGSVSVASAVPWEGEPGCDSPAFGVSSDTRGPGSSAPAETPAARIKNQANRATVTRATWYHPRLGADRPGTFPVLGGPGQWKPSSITYIGGSRFRQGIKEGDDILSRHSSWLAWSIRSVRRDAANPCANRKRP